MSVLTGLLERIRGKRQERFTSTAEAYDDCVHKLASGQEVDLDHLATLLDDLDKSDSDLESDVADKQRRIAARSELDRLTELSKTLPAKKQTVAKLQQELADFVSKKRPAIEALNAEIKMAQLECDRASYVESELLSVGIPLSIQQRKSELAKRQRTLSEKQDRYRDMTEASVRTKDALTVRRANVQSDIAKSAASHHTENLQHDSAELQRRIAQCESQIQAWEPLRLEIEQEQAAVHHESSEIRKLLMSP